ncbi:NAD-dependent epimerase/dehydratase family protein [Egicoccus halophilus]|uniref:Nucleoside-diphosphate sugar epimerase n=1 Tax=Egicoccus halophilus TaxID=1670830 RepID=A0A8J3AAZ3_9ACTN|nr:NAD-dependent epimerase/dehydratase family protein [Egicoccus halophilus]GGI02442.1 nucleoside-diphosphate sugar epimerase [Egicoccus halophilus]
MTAEKILVTGGFGAIGSWVTRLLVEDGHDVTVFSRRRDLRLLPEMGDAVQHVAGSILDRETIDRALATSSIDRVIHCAAALSSSAEKDPRLAYETNVIGSLNIFEAARDAGIGRVVYTSTKGVYGRLPAEHGPPQFAPIHEGVEGTPMHVYGASKKALEAAADHCRRLWGLEIIALRLGSTFGPGKGGQHAGYAGLKAQIVDAALAGRHLRIDNADVADDVVYNADVGRGHVLAAFAPPSTDGVFNIASGQLTTLRAWAEEVMRQCPDHRLEFGDHDETKIASATQGVMDIQRARRELGYEPAFPGVSGVADYVTRERAVRGGLV